MPAKII